VESFLTGPRHTVKILIVDTDPKTLRDLGAALRREGCEPLEAPSFEEARRLWSTERPAVLIADVRLGQFNGLQLLLRARADRPDVTGVIMSAIPDKVLEADTRRFGGTFLAKPVAPDQLMKLLQAVRTSADGAQTLSDDERRTADRRRLPVSDFMPDRRLADRRKRLDA
jgi:two-component system response regulator RegA